MTHFTWDTEYNGKCRKCGAKPILIVVHNPWVVDEESVFENEESICEIVCVDEEVSAHYCMKCGEIISLSFNKID